MDENKTVRLERHRNCGYSCLYNLNGKYEKYVWQKIKGNIVSYNDVPMYVYNKLAAGNCFTDGELIVAKDTSKELKEELDAKIVDIEKRDGNSITKEDVISIMGEKTKSKFEKRLNAITSDTAKLFFVEVVKEQKLFDDTSKLKAIKEWYGVDQSEISIEDLFEI